jgi:hypothetical protein
MREQATTLDQERRRQIFLEVQKTFAANLPMLHFAAPRLWTAHSTRVVGAQPSVLRPPLLWAADSLGVAAQDGD